MPLVNNLMRASAPVYVRITAPAFVRGTPVEVDDVVEVDREDAGLLEAANRGVIVPKPKDDAKKEKK